MNKLKRCPFCGGEAELIKRKSNFPYIHGVWCIGCNCRTSFEKSEEIAIEKWNNRKPVDDVLEHLEELKMAEYDDSDEEPEFADAEELFDEGESSGKFKAYGNAIKIIKEELGGMTDV